MGFHQLKRKQFFEQPVEKLWEFIADPKNLKKITPDYMGFDITSNDLTHEMYPGMLISYKVSPILGIKTTWVTEITHIKTGVYFIDEQRIGPYKLWHHQHFLKGYAKRTWMSDIVSYQPPFGMVGDMINKFLIQKKLKEIFDYREKVLKQLF